MVETRIKKRWEGKGGYREVLVIAVPMILSTGAWAVQHFVDRMFLTWYSPEAIAAAMPAGIFNFTIMSFFIGVASYVNTFVAQYYGADRQHRIGPAVWQALYVSMIGGIVLILLAPASSLIFNWVGHVPAVREHEIVYFRILCIGAFPGIASSALSGFFLGRGKPWPVMWVNTVATAVNLVMDYALIFGKWGFPELGIRGAGFATVLAGLLGFFIYMVLVFRKKNNQIFQTVSAWRPEKDLFLRLLRFGVPSGVQFCLDMAGFTAFIFLVGRLGTPSLAASNIAFNINSLAFMPMIGCGIAVSVLVGQYLGNNQPKLAQRSVYSGFHLTFLYMTTIAAAYVLIPDVFVSLFAAKADTERFAEIYPITIVLLRFVAAYSVFDGMNIIFASAIKGAGDTRFVMMVLAAASIFVLVLPTYVAVVILKMGLMTTWFIATADVILLSIIFYFRFLGGKWKSMRVIEMPIENLN